ncbi:hypothetical protein B0H19DRAFT_1256797 [Mycena capillaripes]|nr:hypothetical protein B0H19DRAFT_1256797 [Mycena capillaripes]
MNADANTNGNPDVISPHKTVRTGISDDTSQHLPSLRTDRERPSPGPNRKVSGSGAPKKPPGLDGITTDIFASTQNGVGRFTLRTVRGSPAKTGRSQSLSPTPSRRSHGPDTGHHNTDVEASDLEEGQILEDTSTPRTAENPIDGDIQITGHIPAAAPNAPEARHDGEVEITGYTPATHTTTTAADDVADEDDHPVPMLVDVSDDEGDILDNDNDNDIFEIASQQAAASRTATPMEGHAFDFDNEHQAARHSAGAAADAVAGEAPPYPVHEGAQPHPLTAANAVAAQEQDAPRGAYPFVFADPQQARAHIAGRQANAAPMFVFGMQGREPMAVVDNPNVQVLRDGIEMQGIIPAPAAAIPNGVRAVQGVLLDGPQGPAIVFVFPDLKVHAETQPTDQHLNPHRNLPAVEPQDPAGPADVGRARKVQPNSGDFARLVISEESAFENVHEDDAALLRAEPNLHGLAIVANGGEYWNTRLGKTFVKEVEEALSPEFGTEQDRFLFPIAPADPEYGKKGGQVSRYAPPMVFGIRFSNPELLTKYRDQGQFGLNRTVGGGTNACRAALRGALSQFMWIDPGFGRALVKYQPPGDATSLDERRYRISQSIDPRWDPHMEAYVVFVKPCTTSALHWEAITDTFSGAPLREGYFKFTPLVNPAVKRLGPRCVVCKGTEHFASSAESQKAPLHRATAPPLTEGLVADGVEPVADVDAEDAEDAAAAAATRYTALPPHHR